MPESKESRKGGRKCRALLLASSFLTLAPLWTSTGPAQAQDATWLANPGSNDFTDANNWSPASVPTGTATFGTSTVTAIDLGGAALTFDSWTFNAGNYTFDIASTQTFTGAGIVFNGGSAIITVVDGALDFRNSSSAASATINLSNVSYKTSYFRNTSTAANATFNISSNDSLWFRDQSTAANATIVNNGTVITWDNATLGDAHITNNRALYFENDSTAGNATIINNGLYIYFYYSSTAGNATITNNTSLNFWSDSSAGSAHITNAVGGKLDVVNNSTLANATVINNGQMAFGDGFNTGHLPTAGQATITNNAGGTIEFGRGSTAGSATITNAGTVSFSTLTMLSGFVSGTRGGTAGNAQLINNASGAIFDFSGSAGVNDDGKVNAGSIAGNGTFSLGANELTVGSNNLSTNVTGVIADGGTSGGTGGSLVKTGTGTLTLSGTNTYTGATVINGGVLVVNGSIAASSSLTMGSGTTLGGNGTVGATTIASGATLAPGNSIGTLAVSGNLAFNTGTTYSIEVSPIAADRTNVTGIATLTGATVQAVALPGSFSARTYTILSATGGLVGTFSGLTTTGTFTSPLSAKLSYDTNNVYLVLAAGTIVLPSGASGNQSSVAVGINNAVLNGGTPPAGFDTLLNTSGSQLTNALNQVSGQPAGGAATSGTQMTTSFMTLMLNPFSGGSSSGGGALGYARGFGVGDTPKAAEAYAAVTPKDKQAKDKQALAASFNQRWSLWGSGYGGTNQRGGDASTGSADTSTRTYGFAAGADYRPAADWLVGFALAGGNTSWSLSQGLGGGKSDVFQIGAFASKSFGAAYVSGALTYAWHDVTTDRTVTVSGVDKLEARYHAHSFGARLEAGYRLLTPWIGVTPYAALQAQSFRTPSYGETATSGSNTFALAYGARTSQTLRTELGAWFDKSFALDSGDLITLRSRAAWAHDHANDNGINAAFQTLPGSSFTVNGTAAPKNAALVSLGGEWQKGRVTLGARFDGEFADRSQSYSGTGSLRYAW